MAGRRSSDLTFGAQAAAWARYLVWAILIAGSAPMLLAEVFGGFDDYAQSPWWTTLRPWVWGVLAIATFGLMFVAVGAHQMAAELTPRVESNVRPTPMWRRVAIAIAAVALPVLWIHSMQAVVLPKVLHVLSHPEPASVSFVSTGKRTLRRRSCDPVTLITPEYGEVKLCPPEGHSLALGDAGLLGGTRTIYGFWIQSIEFQDD